MKTANMDQPTLSSHHQVRIFLLSHQWLSPLQERKKMTINNVQYTQCKKKLMSDSPRPVNFIVRLVDFTLQLPEGQVNVLGKLFWRKLI